MEDLNNTKGKTPPEGKYQDNDARLSRNIDKSSPENERSGLVADREKLASKNGKGLDPDRNSGDR